MTAPDPVAERRPYRFDERLRMVPVDPEGLAARVAQAHPDDFASFRQTGLELMLLGRHDEALDHLDRALELARAPRQQLSVWINLADVYRYRGDAPTAEILYRRAVEDARGTDAEALSFAAQHLGKALAEQGRLDEARELLTEALRLRVAEGDIELIESTRTALDGLAELPIPLPPAVLAVVGANPEFSDEHEGLSGGVALVNGAYWVKRGPRATAEHDRLNWLRARGIQVPEVAAFAEDVLVLGDAGAPSLAARDRSDRAAASPSIGTVMGELLRRLHALPVAECPFDGRLDTALALARRHVLEGLVDPDDFDDDNAHLDPGQVLDRLVAERPETEDLVVAHGDFTPPNVLENGTLLDVGGLGVADRYRDLALAERDLREDFGDGEVRAFFAAYGLDAPDKRRLDYYRLLDELF
ncbi:phosphotransferase [Nocardia sp. bgisy118]|uniref:phosphotransferase n=1 Tax=Nocardia sp. bgisy118 TaxID=3413786 RepID=UPI003F49B4E3